MQGPVALLLFQGCEDVGMEVIGPVVLGHIYLMCIGIEFSDSNVELYQHVQTDALALVVDHPARYCIQCPKHTRGSIPLVAAMSKGLVFARLFISTAKGGLAVVGKLIKKQQHHQSTTVSGLLEHLAILEAYQHRKGRGS